MQREREIGPDTLIATPKGFFSSVIFLKQGQETVATIEMKFVRQKATITIGENVWTLQQTGKLKGEFLLENADGTVIAHAKQPSVWKDGFTVTYGTMEFALKRESAWKDNFVLWWNDESLGKIDRPWWFSRDTRITLAKSLPLEVRAFILWVVIVQWNRRAAV